MPVSEKNGKMYVCPLCGHNFERTDAMCSACPMASSSGCNVVCCPNCGYSFSEESKIVDWFRRKFGRKDDEKSAE